MDKSGQDNKPILYGIIGFLAGALITIIFARSAVNNNNMDMMKMMGMRTQMMQEEKSEMQKMHGTGMDMSMNEMTESLKGKTGDEFDKAFIKAMINHHQGAIEMANLAKTNTKHDEIKTLADDIVNAQTKEISLMREWQKLWEY